MTKYSSKIIQINVFPMSETSPVFAEGVTEVALDDDGDGEFITLIQHNDTKTDRIVFNDIEELMVVIEVVKQLLETPKSGVHNE